MLSGSPLHRNAMYLMLNAVVSMGLGFLFWLIAARVFDPFQVGLASTLVSAILFLGNLCRFGVGVSLVRFLASYEDKDRMVSTCVVVPIGAGLAIGILFIGLARFISPDLSFLAKSAWKAALFVAFLVVWAPTIVMDSIFISYRRAEYVALRQLLIAGLRFPFLYFVAYLGGLGIFVAWGFSSIVALLATVFLFYPMVTSKRFPRPAFSSAVARTLFKLSSANYVAFILSSVPPNLLPILITSMVGSDTTAFFYISWTIASALFFVPNAVGGSLLAEGAADRSTAPANTRRSINFSNLFVMPGSALLFVLGGTVLSLFGKAYSENALAMLRLLCLSAPFVVVTNIYVARMNIEERLSGIVIVTAITTAGTLLAYFLFVGSMGLVSIGIGWLVSQVVASAYAMATGLLRA